MLLGIILMIEWFELQKILSLNTSEISSNLHRFALRADLLPCYIPVRVANKILFVGESVQMFENEKKPNSLDKGRRQVDFYLYQSLNFCWYMYNNFTFINSVLYHTIVSFFKSAYFPFHLLQYKWYFVSVKLKTKMSFTSIYEVS